MSGIPKANTRTDNNKDETMSSISTPRHRQAVLQLASLTNNVNDGQIIDFDDGHIPENFVSTDSSSKSTQHDGNDDDERQTKLVFYPSFFQDKRPTVHVLDNAVPQVLVDALYHVTANGVRDGDGDGDGTVKATEDPPKPWGIYVTFEQIEEYLANHNNNNNADNRDTIVLSDNIAQDRETLAVAAASYFLSNALKISNATNATDQSTLNVQTHHPSTVFNPTTTATSNTIDTRIWTRQDQHKAHGVAVWALASAENSQVPYHLDYAEQIRYEYNVIVPPLLAGTLQCSPVSNMDGGDFWVTFGGLQHYEAHGYKGLKNKVTDENNNNHKSGNPRQENPLVNDKYAKGSEYDFSNDTTSEWVKVPYKYNQMIFQTGQLPHLSTPIKSMEPLPHYNANNTNDNNNPIKRVILGFNVFGHDYGPLVQQAPEHSDIFRRKVKLQRIINQKSRIDNNTNNNNQQQQQQRVSLESIQANKGLSKLLVLAKREKVKQQLKHAQQQLDDALVAFLLEQRQQGVLVETLMQKFGKTDGHTWPSPVDVQVHVNQRLSMAAKNEKENRNKVLHGNGGRVLRLFSEQITDNHGGLSQDPTTRMVLPSDRVYLA